MTRGRPTLTAQCGVSLLQKEFLSQQTSSVDPWGNAFHIDCEGPEATVLSAADNGQFGDEDDIR
ncbi:MAG: hypothetical protein OEZ06_15685 [Myxococcales bacterium]|nr:hypothetical protein [Myxococcales bacterium]